MYNEKSSYWEDVQITSNGRGVCLVLKFLIANFSTSKQWAGTWSSRDMILWLVIWLTCMHAHSHTCMHTHTLASSPGSLDGNRIRVGGELRRRWLAAAFSSPHPFVAFVLSESLGTRLTHTHACTHTQTHTGTTSGKNLLTKLVYLLTSVESILRLVRPSVES